MHNTREDIKGIYSKAIDAVNPKKAVKNHIIRKGKVLHILDKGNTVCKIDLKKYKRIIVTGAGKATAAMASSVEEILGDLISFGCIAVKYGYTENLSKIKIIEASHPIPDENGREAAKIILKLLEDAVESDLIISLISGGGSALLPMPPEPVTLEEKKFTTGLLMKSGASIHEINAVRKHLSLVKGGNLARAAYPATTVNLIISDVVGDDMDVISSGPFVPDNSTFAIAAEILKKYKLQSRVPVSVWKYISDGADGIHTENPKQNSPAFGKVTSIIIASNIIALKAAKEEAKKRGYNSIILSSLFEGETSNAAFYHCAIAREVLSSGNPVKRPACIISGGETVVAVTGSGLGGRNMEFAMHTAIYLNGIKNISAASIGTDGTDGPTDAAGAYADCSAIERATGKGMDIKSFKKNNDSYNFFKELGDLIITGPTNTNVMDVRIFIIL